MDAEETHAAQNMQGLVTCGHLSWPLALICKGGNHVTTSSHTPVLRNMMRFDKMGTDD